MGEVSLTGNDTVSLDSRIFKSLADGETVLLEFPNDIVGVKTGKNGNTLYALNATGKTVNVTMRLLRGTADDKYLNSRLREFINDPASFNLIQGEFIKRVGDGNGNVFSDIYKMGGGVIQKTPGAKENVEGDTEQSVVIYNLVFPNTDRIIA